MRNLLRRIFASPSGHMDQLAQAQDFLDTMTEALRNNRNLFITISVGKQEAGAVLCGGKENSTIEYLYNFAAAAVLRIQGDQELCIRSCPNCRDLGMCQLPIDKRYPCEHVDLPVCDAETAQVD